MVVQECCSLVELYTGIRNGSIEVPSTSSRPFEFPETYNEQLFSIAVIGPLSAMQYRAAKLGEVAAFGTYLKFMVERPGDCDTAAKRTPTISNKY